MFLFPFLFEREKRLPLPSNRRGSVDASEHHDGERNDESNRHFKRVHHHHRLHENETFPNRQERRGGHDSNSHHQEGKNQTKISINLSHRKRERFTLENQFFGQMEGKASVADVFTKSKRGRDFNHGDLDSRKWIVWIVEQEIYAAVFKRRHE